MMMMMASYIDIEDVERHMLGFSDIQILVYFRQ